MEGTLFDWGRFSEAAFLLLVSLAGGAKHGYAMMEDIAAFADVRLRAGTLYGALTRDSPCRASRPKGRVPPCRGRRRHGGSVC